MYFISLKLSVYVLGLRNVSTPLYTPLGRPFNPLPCTSVAKL